MKNIALISKNKLLEMIVYNKNTGVVFSIDFISKAKSVPNIFNWPKHYIITFESIEELKQILFKAEK